MSIPLFVSERSKPEITRVLLAYISGQLDRSV